MKLMLGDLEPWVLVSTSNDYDPANFKFYVENGAWEGHFYKGYVTVYGAPSGDYTSLVKVGIICDNQDRLRGDWQTVFDNFDNADYVAPPAKEIDFSWLDDDIPF